MTCEATAAHRHGGLPTEDALACKYPQWMVSGLTFALVPRKSHQEASGEIYFDDSKITGDR